MNNPIPLHANRGKPPASFIGRLAIALLAAATLSASAKTTEFDWCTVDAPETWTPGGPFQVAVTLKPGIPAGTQLSVHLQWFKKAGGYGGMLSYRKPQDAAVGTELVFDHSNKKLNPDIAPEIGHAGLNVFLAPGGGRSASPPTRSARRP